jgi:hypothetical protein
MQGDLEHDYRVWETQQGRRPACPDGTFSRCAWETFLQTKRVLTRKWMGAKLGMTEHSLVELLSHLPHFGMRPQRYVPYEGLVSESLPEDLVRNMAGLRFRTFSGHNSFCNRLHGELAATVGLTVEPLFCATSDRFQESPREFASTFDCLTLEPLSVKHQVWLDFHKPLNLGPDRCSKLLYVENRERLAAFCAGTREPEDLNEYERFLAGSPQ